MARPLILVLGGYGFIGAAIVRALDAAGFGVRALGRDQARARGGPAEWVIADMADMTDPSAWTDVLDGVEAVVNAAGSLQDGPRDRVSDVQARAVQALAQAAGPAGVGRLVQISAVGARSTAATTFMASKGVGDAAVRGSGVEHVILRPGLVLGRTVYGGTALLRMFAAVPLIQPLAYPAVPIQVVDNDDVARAAVAAVRGDLPNGFEADLVAEPPVSLRALTAGVRQWLGFRPARAVIPVPGFLARGASAMADGLGRLGWRSPLRSTAMRVLAHGVTGDPGPWRALGQPPPQPLEKILAAHPATLQDRWHARLALLFPLVIAILSLFWLASGVFGFWQMGRAAAVLDGTGLPELARYGFVIGGAVADIALGALVLMRRHARLACLGMIGLSLAYLVAGTWLTPGLWADPLGPFVKVIPSIVLAVVALALLEDR